MEYLIFNEASVPFNDLKDVDKYFPVFLEIISSAFKNRFKAIRIEESPRGWFELPLTRDIVLREWLEYKDNKDRCISIKSLIDKTEISYISTNELNLSDRFALSSFSLLDDTFCQTPALGACYLSSQLAISFRSATKWNSDILQVEGKELTEKGDVNICADVKNCAIVKHWNTHLENIEHERKDSLRKGSELWNSREEVFPNLVFCGKTFKQLTDLSVSNIVYNQLYNALKQLNVYCAIGREYSLADINELSCLNITDESDSVKNNPKLKRHRMFSVNGVSEFFGYHIKNFSGALRLHIFPVASENKIYVGYFGKHLPTKKS